jgi:FMN phosphatase YigB (HAD superfamily)
MTRTQAIVFDMDGVLIDSEELHAHAGRIAFAHAGIVLSDADLPSQCLVVEDSLTGVLSAKHAGCCVSALTRTFAAQELLGVGADFIFEDFQSLKRSAEIEKYCRWDSEPASLDLLLRTLDVRSMRSTQAHLEPEEHSECLATTRLHPMPLWFANN